MKQLFSLLIVFSFGFTQAQTVSSPSGKIALSFQLSASGQPTYSVNYKTKSVVVSSDLGIQLKDKPALNTNFEIQTSKNNTFNETWKPVLGEQTSIVNHYNELVVALIQKGTNIKVNLVFRAFDEGVAFRYDFPKQKELNYFIISNEDTQFNLTENNKVFWLPGDFDSNEYEYNETQFSDIDNSKINMNNGIGVKSIPGKYTVQTPLMMKSPSGLYVNIFEAAVVNYPVMHLKADVSSYKLKSELVPNAIGDKAYLQTPCVSPWRTIMISDDARDIVASKMILNLNEPSKLEDTSWIKPMKYVGIWWEMHVGNSTWDYAGSQNATTDFGTKLASTGRHGATTANTKRYIDFAAKHGFDGVLVEGWNEGWEDWSGNWKEEVFDFVTPYPDFDIAAISAYAKEKNVKMIMHHETSGSVANYERRLDRAFENMVKYNYPAVKTGYVGKIIPRGEMHDGQTMVNHFAHVVKRAADYKLMVNSHESSHPTGLGRTYPNYVAAEAARGNEFNAWSIGNPPMHETILPFTRQLGGPMDYTPGIFEIKMSHYDKKKTEQVKTTLAKQLALYVTIYSPIQMAADLPENYEKYSDAFQFIKDVALDWEDSKYLQAEPGDYLTVARKAKGKQSWFLGAITDENARKTEIKLDFLTKGKKYKAIIYEDAKDADWKMNPKAYSIRSVVVTNASKIKLNLAPGVERQLVLNPSINYSNLLFISRFFYTINSHLFKKNSEIALSINRPLMKKSLVAGVLFFNGLAMLAQTNDEQVLKDIYKSGLTNAKCYSWLDHLSNKIGARLSGSDNAEKAVQYTKSQLETLGLDKVYLQEMMVPKWVRGEKETAYILDNKTKISVPIAALGGSVATSKNGLTAAVIEVQGIEDLKKWGGQIKGKIVFYNRPMDPTFIETFKSYGGCVDQRYAGAKEAAKLGAVGTIVRSMNLRLDDFPHTGAQSYGDLSPKEYIPTAAISTNGAELLSQKLKANPNLKFYFKQSCEQMPDALSYNVIGEIKGSEHPENIMVVGGHLDSWDLADGSHDDGAGVVQSMETLRIFKQIGYKPKNTIRVVLFMNEENGGRGGKKYAELAQTNHENHIFALESDSGGFSPRGFSIEADDVNYQKILSWKNLFEPYLIHSFVKGGAGADINPLSSGKIVKAGLKPDSQRYFDYHHALNDNFDAINKRELELGAATMTSLLYLMDQNGIIK